MDDDPLLRALGEELARDDPDLAARLTAGPGALAAPPCRGILWALLLGAAAAVAAPLLLGPAAFGVMALLVLISCPFALSCWLPVADPWPDDPPSWDADPGNDP